MEPARQPAKPVIFYGVRPPAARAARPFCPPARKRLVRRPADRTQLIRRSVQGAFLLLNLWIGARFYFFVRYYETGGATPFVARPAGVEGWLPIAGLMNLKYLITTGRIPDVHPAGLFLLLAFLALSFLFRKAFCSWLCPIGTLSEWLWQGGREILGRNLVLPRWIDIPLRALKYLLLAFFLWAILNMSARDIVSFLQSPYGAIADVKMLNFFRHLGTTAAWVIAVLIVSSIFVKNAWCRFLCPYGALLGLASLVSPARIRRDPDACIDCAKCAKVCPSLLPVDRVLAVRSAECTGCLECVSVCPARDALDLAVGRRRVPGYAVAVGLVLLLATIVGVAKVSGHWETRLDEEVLLDLIPKASAFSHPPVGGR